MKAVLSCLRNIAFFFTFCFASMGAVNAADGGPTCHGKFPNPITDFCWSCIFPLKLGGASLITAGQEDTPNPGGFFCACNTGGIPKIGIKVSFWEPARLVESVRTPFCFPTLAGAKLDFGFDAPAHGRPEQDGQTKSSFYQVHWYINPLLFWLEVLVDNSCLEQNVFDMGYFTEVDPLWDDSELTFIINPDVALFANVPSQAACSLDCAATSAGFANNALFWCAGCQGSLYPLNGHVNTHGGGVRSSELLTQRMTAKMHREGLIWAASGNEAMCGYYVQPVMDKTNYKAQLVYPSRATEKIGGKCCNPYGRTTALWGAGKEFPYRGEDFSYQVFRKRNCCQGSNPF